MKPTRKPLIDYMAYDYFNVWSCKTLIALDKLIKELEQGSLPINTNIEKMLKDVVVNVYIEAFRDGNEFRRWMDSQLF